MSLLCIAAVRRRMIPFWLAVMVAVVGGVGPFAGTHRVRLEERETRDRQYGVRGARETVSEAPEWRSTPRSQVVMPQMGDSVSEGTVLEWHKQEGDHGLGRRDARRDLHRQGRRRGPRPRAGHRREDPRRRGRHRRVGACSPRSPRTAAAPAAVDAEARPPPRTPPTGPRRVEIVMPAMGESVTEGTVLEWDKQPGDASPPTRRSSRSRPTRSTPRSPPRRRHDHRGAVEAGRHRQRRPGPRAHERAARRRRRAARRSRRAEPAPPARPAEPAPTAPQADGVPRTAPRSRPSPAASPPPHGVDLSQRPRQRPAAGASPRTTCSAPATARHPRRTGRRAGEHATLHQGRRGDARPLHGRVAARSRPRPPSARITVTTLDARRKQLKAAGHKVSFTHLIAYAIARAATEQMPVMAHHFAEHRRQAAPRRRRRRQPRHRGRRREEGRRRAR